MKDTSKTLLVAVGALIPLVLALVLVIMPQNMGIDGPDTDTRQDDRLSDADLPDMGQHVDAAVSDGELPQSRMPVLRIGARQDHGIYLQSLDINVEVTGNIASTRYTMVFKNSTGRDLEGELTFPLPDGRTATHYALDVDGKMRDAVPVEKVRATQVFEEIQQRVQAIDPGILERVEGNNFRTRIYPFPRFGTRTISVGYEEELSLENGLLYYRLPMAYPSPLKKFAVTATVWNSSRKPLVPGSGDELRFDRTGEDYVASFSGENYRPSRALVFALPAPADVPQAIMQSAQGSHYFLASVAPALETRKKRWGNDLAIIWDVSLSGSQRNLEHEFKALDIIFAEKQYANVHLYFLNNRLKKIANVNSSDEVYRVAKGDWSQLKNVLQKAVFDGGTDFSQINLNSITGDEILFFSDGLSTLSDADFIKNARAVRPVHCIVSSAQADYSAMKLISGKTKGKFVNINALSSEKLKDELLNETLQFLGVEHGKSVREVYPSIATPVQGNFSVAGISTAGSAEMTLLFGFGSKVERRIPVKLDASRAGRQGNVFRIWAQKKIEELDLDFDRNRAELTELGKQFGIVTRNTSLIVLEFMDDYVLFNIEPPASEPQMRAEYHQRRRGRDRDLRDTERTLLAEAASTAQSMRKWWGTGFKLPDDPKYPVPDDVGSRSFESSDRKRVASGGSGGSTQGGGDPRARVTQMGVIGVVSGNIKGRSTASSDIFGSGGFSSDIDAILSGVGGLKSGGDGGTGRRGEAGIGFGSGYGSGFGGSGGGIDDLLGGLMGGSGSSGLDLKRRGELRVSSPDFLKSGNSSRPAANTGRETASKSRETASKSRETASISREAASTGREANIGRLVEMTEAQKAKAERVKERLKKLAELGHSAYMVNLTGNTAEDYQEYLNLRNDHLNSPQFYFEMSSWFYSHGDREAALRVLTSIAELDIENAANYRLLGYRFKEFGEHTLQKFAFRKVLEWRPLEPQSLRDYALALADNGEAQAALDSLGVLLTRSYSTNIGNRSRGIDEVVITEINNLIAKNPRLSTSRIDRRLRMSMPVDVRVVLNWNLNNTNVDLSVVDPTGEGSFFRDPRWSGGRDVTMIGGRMSADNSSGYGPEQFTLRKAVKGQYQVYAHYRSAREFAAAGPVTVMAEIYTNYGTRDEQRRVVTMQLTRGRGRQDWDSRWSRLSGWGNNVLMGEFEI